MNRNTNIQVMSTQPETHVISKTNLLSQGQLEIPSKYITQSPYYYDSGYWLDPWYWWYGDKYYRQNRQVYNNNIHTVNNYSNSHGHGNDHGNATNPTHEKTIHTMPIVQPVLGQMTPLITDKLPRPKLIAPSEDSIFPLPTLASSIQFLPEQVTMPSLVSYYTPSMPINPVEMPNHSLPRNDSVDNVSTMSMPMPDNLPAPVDIMASQSIGQNLY